MTSFPALAVVLGLGSGALFGMLVHFQKRGLISHDPLSGAFITVLAMTLFLWVLSPFFIDYAWFNTPAARLFLVAGLIFPAAAQVFQVFSLKHVGPALTSAMGAFVPFFAAVPAVIFLHENFGLQLAIGMSLMTIGLVYSALSSRKFAQSWPVWALLLPLGAAATRGMVMPITKSGLNMLDSPFFATLMVGSVSSCVLACILIVTGRKAALWPRGLGVKWFVLGGMVNATGILCVNTAIGLAGVTLAAPLAATAPLWALFFGYFIFKSEVLSPRHILVAVLVVTGAALIVTR